MHYFMCFSPQIKDRIYIYQLWNLKNSKIHWASTCDNENENIYGFAKRLLSANKISDLKPFIAKEMKIFGS